MKIAEKSWQQAYESFSNIDFTAYDFYSIKNSMIKYVQENFPESFNNFIENDKLMMTIELFAYLGELMAYRMDINANENLLDNAQRKNSILQLAKVVSYNASRNINFSGMLKITSVTTTNNVYDSRGVNLANSQVMWNDPNNNAWLDQFITIMNDAMTTKYGSPYKVGIADSYNTSLYTVRNQPLPNNVLTIAAMVNQTSFPLEIVSADIDSQSKTFTERCPATSQTLSIAYINDNTGVSNNTGFMLLAKQGSLSKISNTFTAPVQNRIVNIESQNVNNNDVWVCKLDLNGNIESIWSEVNNIYFNEAADANIYEVETLENDAINLIFGDGSTANIPTGVFDVYYRESANQQLSINSNDLSQIKIVMPYYDAYGRAHTLTMYATLAITLSKSLASQDINDIRKKIPGSYFNNNRMISNQDYNTFLTRENDIKKITAINRTFIGESAFSDASGTYQNVNIFNTDLSMMLSTSNSETMSGDSTRYMIDNFIEPILSKYDFINTLLITQANISFSDDRYFINIPANALRHAQLMPRDYLLEDYGGKLLPLNSNIPLRSLEKTKIQGYLDSHYYGNARNYTNTVLINGTEQTFSAAFSIVNGIYDDKGVLQDYERIYDTYALLAVPVFNFSNSNPKYQPVNNNLSLDNSGLQVEVPVQTTFGLRYHPFTKKQNLADIADLKILIEDKQWWTLRCVYSISAYQIFEVIGQKSGTIDRIIYYPNTLNISYIENSYFSIQTNGNAFDVGDTIIFKATSVTAEDPDGDSRTMISSIGYWEVIYDTTDTPANQRLDPNGVYNPNWINEYYSNTTYEFPTRKDSWQILVTTNDGLNYNIKYRSTNLSIYSDSTKFWFNNYNKVLNSTTGKVQYDSISILSSDGSQVATDTYKYSVFNSYIMPNGANANSIEVIPALSNVEVNNVRSYNVPISFSDLIDMYDPTLPGQQTSFIYFKQNTNGVIERCPAPADISFNNNNILDIYSSQVIENSEAYYRYCGTGAINNTLSFLWNHYSPLINSINPSTNNIIDIYILQSSYYNDYMNWLYGLNTQPSVPQQSDLIVYNQIVSKYQSTTDQVVLHSATLVPCFGSKSADNYKASIKVTMTSNNTFTDTYIKQLIINAFKKLPLNEFNDTVYFSEITTLIASTCEFIQDVKIIPVVTNSQGEFNCGQFEILVPYIDVTSISVVSK